MLQTGLAEAALDRNHNDVKLLRIDTMRLAASRQCWLSQLLFLRRFVSCILRFFASLSLQLL
jgi:hypothetical protein